MTDVVLQLTVVDKPRACILILSLTAYISVALLDCWQNIIHIFMTVHWHMLQQFCKHIMQWCINWLMNGLEAINDNNQWMYIV